jgi:O-antigen/teichoic acid export membrane protein
MSALVVSILSGFFQIGGLMLLAYCHLLSATTAYWMIGSSCGVVSIVWLVCNKNDYSLNFGQATSALRLNWSQGKWIFGGSMISSISTYLYPWFLATFQGVAEAGTFAACQNVANLPNPFLLSVSNILRPKTALAFTNGGPVLLMRLVKRSTLKIALVMGLYLTLMLIGGEWLTFQIYGSKYVGTGQVVLVLAIGLFAFAVTAPYGYGLIAMERADINFRITITCSLPAILLGLFLIRTYGSIGAAYSLLTFNGAVLIACFILFAGIVRPKQTK